MANGNFAGGSGTVASPYLIEDAHDLNKVKNNLTAYYKLIDNIDLNITPYNSGSGWIPIGESSATSLQFKGSFDGNGFTVRNLFINRTVSYSGLFGYVNGGVIKNVKVENVNIQAYDNSGGLVGYVAGSTSMISNCASSGVINAGNRAYVGGLIGYAQGTTIENCYSHADVYSTDTNTGGLLGRCANSPPTIINCYAIGKGAKGGLVGVYVNAPTITNSYWDVEYSGVMVSAGGTGKSTSEMKTAATFIGWSGEELDDGIKTWIFKAGMYPKLWFEIKSFYATSGTWESPIIDLGEGWLDTKMAEVVKQIATSSYSANLIPSMTSNSAPSGAASGYSRSSTTNDYFTAFDKDNATYWQSSGSNSTWLAYEFSSPVRIQKYTILGSSNSSYNLKEWTFEGWSGSQWIVLDTQSGAPNLTTKKEFAFSNDTSYVKYRINMSSSNSSGTAYRIHELEMMEMLPGVTSCSIEVSTSADGTTFTSYAALDPASPPDARYIKIKATLSATAEASTPVDLDFNQSDPQNTFTLGSYAEAAGQLKLKTQYSSAMFDEGSVGTGKILSSIINKAAFKTIEKVEVA